MSGWLDALASALRRDGRAALVMVAHVAGSTPREAGATMIVTLRSSTGTIGGGHLEFEAMRLARERLERSDAAPTTWLVRFPLAARLGQCCGGVATLALAVVDERASRWIELAASYERAFIPFAIVSRPVPAGASLERIVVTDHDVHGTFGDASLDSTAIDAARARLAGPASTGTCGTGLHRTGEETLLVHVMRPDRFDVLVFGNGHVGRALVQVLAALPARVRWIDARDEDFPAELPRNLEAVPTDTPQSELADAPPGAFIVVTTHSHALDFDLVEAALQRDDWRYLGLIGSKAKRTQFERRLIARGVAPEALARVTCPIGAGNIRSKEPGAIAVAVVAEMLAAKEKGAACRSAGDSRSTTAQSDGIPS